MLASKMGDATSETDELIQSTSELKDKASETSEALKQATQNMTSSMEEVNASGTLANNLTDELVKLAGQSNQTTEQQSRMKTIVMELNTMFPEDNRKIKHEFGRDEELHKECFGNAENSGCAGKNERQRGKAGGCRS